MKKRIAKHAPWFCAAAGILLLLSGCALTKNIPTQSGTQGESESVEENSENIAKTSETGWNAPANNIGADVTVDEKEEKEEINREAKELMEEFLKGNTTVRMKEQPEGLSTLDHYLTPEEIYTWEEIKGQIGRENIVVNVKYAFIDCGNDGVTDLLMKYTVTQEELDSFAYDTNIICFIMYRDGELQITNSYVTWYRMGASINKYGVAFCNYSAPASRPYDGYTWYIVERVNAEGQFESIYSFDHDSRLPEPIIFVVSPDDENFDWDHYEEGEIEHEMYYLPFEEGESVSTEFIDQMKRAVHIFRDKDGNVIYPDEERMKEYESIGFTITDDEGWEKILEESLNSKGMSMEEIEMVENEPEFHILEGVEFADFMKNN